MRIEILIPHLKEGPRAIWRAQYEQIETQQAKKKLSELNIHYVHDPFWRTRFWSIQHVRDVQEGKTWHWFWTPMKVVFDFAGMAFLMWPVAMYLKTIHAWMGWINLLLMFVAFKFALILAKDLIEWYYWWRFERARSKYHA
jgi:hypothetical protein